MKRRAFIPVAALSAASMLSGCAYDPSAIGVIGGADGPTAIFVTTSPSVIPFIAVAACAVVIITVMLIRRKRK